ncbi:hypothetical protein AX16_000693 [Volvariella volvacea WC 439]|nr:hypothetical protein AX16_000693 [Volvariella volvacea WC 439]
MAAQVWFITGSSSGFGRHMTETALRNGDSVIATLRRPAVLDDLKSLWPSTRLLVLQLDVSKKEQILDAFAKGKEHFGRIDVVFNNAAEFVLGEVEGTEEAMARRMLEINFWGATTVSREAVRYFRQNKPVGGRLLQLSSAASVTASPGAGYYVARSFLALELFCPAADLLLRALVLDAHSKLALEGFSEALAAELDPEWNIKASPTPSHSLLHSLATTQVTIIQPGPFRTNAVASSILPPPPPEYATNPALASARFRAWFKYENYDGDAKKAVENVFYKLAKVEDPPLTIPVHRMVVEATRERARRMEEVAREYERWSEDVYVE